MARGKTPAASKGQTSEENIPVLPGCQQRAHANKIKQREKRKALCRQEGIQGYVKIEVAILKNKYKCTYIYAVASGNGGLAICG